jgi:steroid delta-isomerase-like uncharacterized protein
MPAGENVPRAVPESFVHDFLSRWIQAWNSHEAEQVLALMTEDILYEDSAWPTTMRGHAQVREFLDSTWRAFPDLRFILVEGPFLHPQAPKACASWRGVATHTGPIGSAGFPVAGKQVTVGRQVTVEGVDIHEYRQGQLSRLRRWGASPPRQPGRPRGTTD